MPHWVAYKQQKFITHSSRGWEVQGHDVKYWWPSSSVIASSFWPCPYMGEGAGKLCGVSLIRILSHL